MDLTDTQLAAVKNWRPGDLMLSVPIGEKAANIILPIADDDGELMCWQPDYVCIACQNPLVCFVGFGEHIFNLELVAATICMNEERREYAEGFQLLESLSNLVSPNDAIIIKPDAATLRDLVNAGGCTSPHCQQGYMQSDHPVWDCDEVRGRMWNSQPAPRTFRVCPFCIGLDLADEHDEYLKVATRDGSVDSEWEMDFFHRLNERRRKFGYRDIVPPYNISDPALADDAGGYERDESQSMSDESIVVEYTPTKYKSDAASPKAVQDVIRLAYHHLQGESVPLAAQDCDTCAPCEEVFGRDDIVARLRCKHVIHWHCMRKVLQEKPACPSCRAPVEEKAEESGMRDSVEIDEATCGICHRISRGPIVCCGNTLCPHRKPPRWYHVECGHYSQRMVGKAWYCPTCWRQYAQPNLKTAEDY